MILVVPGRVPEMKVFWWSKIQIIEIRSKLFFFRQKSQKSEKCQKWSPDLPLQESGSVGQIGPLLAKLETPTFSFFVKSYRIWGVLFRKKRLALLIVVLVSGKSPKSENLEKIEGQKISKISKSAFTIFFLLSKNLF